MPSVNDKIVVNFKDVRKALAGLPKRVVTNVVRRAVYAGARTIRDAARAKVPVRTGALRSAITARASAKTAGEITASVGIARKTFVKGKKKGQTPRRYAHLVEFGTRHSSAKPFLRPALDTRIDEVLDVTARKMREGIDEEAAKAKR